MQHLVNIRQATGIGQTALAGFLGMTKQALAKVEKGLCSLSSINLVRLARLQACLDRVPADSHKKQTAATEKHDHYNIRELKCRYSATALQRKLEGYESAFQKGMCLYEALGLLEATDEPVQLWIQKTRNNLIKKLDKCGPTTCMRLRKQVYLLIAEADYINRIVNENQSCYENG